MNNLERDIMINQILRGEIDTPWNILLTGITCDPNDYCVKVFDLLNRGMSPQQAGTEIDAVLDAWPEHTMLNLLREMCTFAIGEPVAMAAYLKILASDEMRHVLYAAAHDAGMPMPQPSPRDEALI